MFKDQPSITKLHSTLALRTFRDNGLPDNTDSSQPGTNKLPARRSDREDSAKRCEQKKTTTRGYLTELPLLQSLADEDTNSRSLATVSVIKGVLISHTANVHTMLKITGPKIHPFQDGIMNFEVLNIRKSLDENHILELCDTGPRKSYPVWRHIPV